MAPTRICKPIVPSVHSIPGGVHPDSIVEIQGTVLPSAKRFAINFQCGPNLMDNIALHADFRYDEKYVVLNSFESKCWQHEIRTPEEVIVRGSPFNIVFRITPESFLITINGVLFSSFTHRIPVENISHLSIIGRAAINSINFEETKAIVPSLHAIPGGVAPGTVVRIQGMVPSNAHRFHINFMCGKSPSEEIALHASFRYDLNCVELKNFMECGVWCPDVVKTTYLVIPQGTAFTLVFHIGVQSFGIILEFTKGVQYFDYTHRTSVEKITYLGIDGDVVINSIEFDGSNSEQFDPTVPVTQVLTSLPQDD